MALMVEVAGRSDVGCVRTNNEDNFGYDMRHGIYIVCDGMGGQAAGEVASKMAVDTVLGYFRDSAAQGHFDQAGPQVVGASELAQTLSNAIHLANSAIFDSSTANASRSGMGATTVALHSGKDGMLAIGHVGDSRIYLVREGSIRLLTQDHSLVMEQVRRGLITLEEAKHSEVANIIIRALGAEKDVEPDLDDLVAQPHDVFLLCSDGLTRELEDDQLQEIINANATKPLQVACDALVDAARRGGGNDNITALLLRFAPKPWYSALFGVGGDSPKWQNSI
jgi:serine/threonine protein phosphatase PrpC